MRAYTNMRELTFDEIDMVSGAGWFSDLGAAIAHYSGKAMQMLVDATEWFFENFTVTYSPTNDSVVVTSK